jgi:cellulose synthase/poly-beta-1,6-N-acetylglucosamine synthase-like glycosyltransferase
MIPWLMWGLAGVTGLPLVIFVVEVGAGLKRLPARSIGQRDGPAAEVSVVILIPAHNEELGIAGTVAQIASGAPGGAKILVVADNCTDGTAGAARRSGAEVIERQNPAEHGKGYALSFGRDHLRAAPPDVVIVVDADCRLAPNTIERLAAVTHGTQQPAQCINLLQPDVSASPLVQLSSFAMLIKNLVRSRGVYRLGGTTLLTGTGMAFPWPIFRDAALASGNVVEDLELGVTLTRQGRRVSLVSEGKVSSASAHVDDLLEQRRRWEIGFLHTARRWALPTLGHGLKTGSRAAIALGLHMLVPPLATLVLLGFVILALLTGGAAMGQPTGPAAAVGGLLALASVLTLLAWAREGRSTVQAKSLMMIPGYILWKLPMYLGGILGRQQQWVRTRRRPKA